LLRRAGAIDNAAMEAKPCPVVPPKRKRGWCQFSLRTLLILTTLLGIGAGLLSQKIARKRREWDAVQAILKLGARVDFDDCGASRHGTWVGGGAERDMDEHPTGPRWMRELLGKNFFTDVKAVSIWNVQSENDGLASIKNLTDLVQLHLTNCRVTDGGLDNLEGLTHLQELGLSGTYITDAGLRCLKQLSELRRLSLDNTKVSDPGLISLHGLTRLQSLNLKWTYITDAGLVHLRGLTSLEELWLANSDVTEAGVVDLQKALPKCKIYR
jgi:Leucine-rich repeat (LRR) protein